MPEEDTPDESIWHHQERLNEWFEAVKARRTHGMEPIRDEEPELMRNQLTDELIGR